MSRPELGLSLELKNVVRLSWELLTRQERIRVGALAVGMIINGALQTFSLALLIPFTGLMLNPLALKDNAHFAVIDRLLGSPTAESLLVLCAFALLGAILLKNGFELAYNFYLNRLIANVERRVSIELLARCMAAPYEWFLFRNTSKLVNAIMAHVIGWARAGLKSVLSLTSSAVLVSTILVFLISINPVFGLCLALAGAALGATMLGLVKKHVRRLAARKHDANDETFKILNHALSGFKDIKINSREEFFVSQYAVSQSLFARTNASLSTIQPIPNYGIEIAIALVLVAVGVTVSIDPDLRIQMAAVLAVYGVAIVRMVPIFNQVSGTVNAIHTAVPAIWNIRRMYAELAEAEATAVAKPGIEPISAWDSLTFDDVFYAYPKVTRSAIGGVSFVVERGLRIGIVGRSGAGKTTMVDLLTGLLSPTRGRVLIGQRELAQSNGASWRKQIGYVPQQPFIADDTLRFNVALETDRSSIDDARVREALEVANLGELLKHEMAHGLDTPLGERGGHLSGGQRQRVAIARALYRDPSLLILDEATSSLDTESENEISLALSRISREKTIFIIAHRLSTVKDCDKILVLDKGVAVGFDTHGKLIRTCPLYRRLVELGDLSPSDADPDTPAASSEDDDQPAFVALK